MTDFFFYGTLCHPPLLRAVLGRDVSTTPAQLEEHAVFWAEGRAFPLIVEGAGQAEGILVTDLTHDDVARLDYYEGGFAYDTRDVTVEAASGKRTAHVYFPQPGNWTPGEPWRLSDWVARWGDVAVATVKDFMRQYGVADPASIQARYPMMLMRAGARVRASQEPGPARIRRNSAVDDVSEDRVSIVYANYFSVEEYDLRFRRFDGRMSPTVNRGVFVSGDAAVVLPYDPVRDRVLLIEQFRMGPYGRGDPRPWLLEAVAGRIDGGETPEEAARREAVEEAGLDISELIAAAHYYPSPAAKGEYLYTYIGIADLPDEAAGLGGVPGEDEDIRAHILPFPTLMELVESGEVNTAPLVLLAYWLERHREGLMTKRSGG